MKCKIPILLAIVLLLASMIAGCSVHPKGMSEPRLLSGEEKAALVSKAFTTDEVKSLLEGKEFYQVRIGRSMIKWQDDGSLIEININTKYEYEEYQEQFTQGLAAGKQIYSAVIIDMGDPIDYNVTVSINPDTLEIADIQSHPLTPAVTAR